MSDNRSNKPQSMQAPKPTSTRVCCRLCSCEGVKGTVLCKEHLEGFQYACDYLRSNGRYTQLATKLQLAIQQRKEQDNG